MTVSEMQPGGSNISVKNPLFYYSASCVYLISVGVYQHTVLISVAHESSFMHGQYPKLPM